jgi:mono/diheme cytochrome c family protein
MAEGRRIFGAFSCGACHVLADADGSGQVGPALDGNAALTHGYVVDIVTNGRGAMPGFGGQMSDEEIALLATYIVQARK